MCCVVWHALQTDASGKTPLSLSIEKTKTSGMQMLMPAEMFSNIIARAASGAEPLFGAASGRTELLRATGDFKSGFLNAVAASTIAAQAKANEHNLGPDSCYADPMGSSLLSAAQQNKAGALDIAIGTLVLL